MPGSPPTSRGMDPNRREAPRRRNRRTAIGVGAFVCGMVGLAFASVPLYDLFCRATGYNGTVQVGGPAAPGASGRVITVRFNANTQPDLPWRFAPGQGPMQVREGEEA